MNAVRPRETSKQADVTALATTLCERIGEVVVGKPRVVRLAVCALAARGHLLVEDVPGVGKTTLARAVARSVGGSFRRIQCTSDLLPSDVLGGSVYLPEAGRFEPRLGPIFANVVLADELNRAPPRTQSALLEAMGEGSVSLDDQTHALPRPFLLVATQNPLEHFGTYPLPESQLDRFLLRIRIGYLDAATERRLVRASGEPIDERLDALAPAVTPDELAAVQAAAAAVRVDDSLLDYCERVVRETRSGRRFALPVSTRGFQSWFRAAQAWALLAGRDYCVPDDFQEVALPSLAHRVVVGLGDADEGLADGLTGAVRDEAEQAIAELLERIPVPA